MSSRQSTVDFVVDQISTGQAVEVRRMFGQHGLFCEGRIVALLCNDDLYINPTRAGRIMMDRVVEERPFPWAKKLWWRVLEDRWDDHRWLSRLVQVSHAELQTLRAISAVRHAHVAGDVQAAAHQAWREHSG